MASPSPRHRDRVSRRRSISPSALPPSLLFVGGLVVLRQGEAARGGGGMRLSRTFGLRRRASPASRLTPTTTLHLHLAPRGRLFCRDRRPLPHPERASQASAAGCA